MEALLGSLNRGNDVVRYRCAGIGVGPSNLSVASLLHDYRDISNIFFEKKPRFSWHDGMQFSESNLQVAIFKDLVTLADPTNSFSFISYLHSQGKIYHFLNAQFDSVPRREFSNYLEWACKRNDNIHVAEGVERIEFNNIFTIETTRRRIEAENICVGVGIEPKIPPFVRQSMDSTNFHVADFNLNARNMHRKRIVVVGGGQSGADTILSLISGNSGHAPAQVYWISSRDNFLPLDDSPFTNDYFMPCHSNYFFEQKQQSKKAFVERNILASDGISERTLRKIYQRIYALRFIDAAPPEVTLMPDRLVVQSARDGARWNLVCDHRTTHQNEIVCADIVIWATGFRPAQMDFLSPILPRIKRDNEEISIDDEFAAVWDGPSDRCIFMLNAARGQRGLPDPNLSLTAWRSQRIIDRIRGLRNTNAVQIPSFITWAATSAAEKREAV
jgi:lysine N6-hydroxylase